MDLGLDWQPHLPPLLVALLALGGAVAVGLAAAVRARGWGWRLAVFALVLLALLNPVLIAEERERLPDIAALVIDTSASQDIGDRNEQARAAAAKLREKLAAIPGLDLRVIESGTAQDHTGGGTALFEALSRALADAPPERIAGAIFVTDGQVHDVPADGASPIGAPVHALLTGAPDEADRKLTVTRAPRFGIVGERIVLALRVDDHGVTDGPATTMLTLRLDGGTPEALKIPVGREVEVPLRLSHGGENVVELGVDEGPRELTLLNNRAIAVVNGVRDRLRVLLISGEPHAGERTWRNLLKADPSVDLVHFTILRPPEKQDNTPIDELSLIAFPTRELFVEKLDEFDLIIFDRYRRRAILPAAYYANISDYVEKGGALLVASGLDYSSPLSIYRTALGSVLPGRPTGQMLEEGFKPMVSQDGARHPVTADLPGANRGDALPTWGRWFRLVEADRVSGRTLMAGPGDRPLLILDRVGEGRVALMLSDHAWLWTRGVEGGGPQAELLRRLAHWLMKEPDLEEERLTGRIEGGVLRIERRSMSDTLPPVTVTAPSGVEQTLPVTEEAPGRFRAEMPAGEQGLYRLAHQDLRAVVASGPLNAREFSDVRASAEPLTPVAENSGGRIAWLAGEALPDIRLVAPGRETSGGSWIGLRDNGRYVVTAVSETALLHPALALLLILGTLLWAWRVEGR